MIIFNKIKYENTYLTLYLSLITVGTILEQY